MLRRLGRFSLLVALGILGAGLLVGIVGAAQLGNSASRDVVLNILDDKHIIGPKTHWLREARHLERANPARDALRAIKHADTRLLGLADIGPFLPGLDSQQFQSYAARYGVRLLAAGCEISCDEEMRYRDAGAKYAETYNRVIVAALKR